MQDAPKSIVPSDAGSRLAIVVAGLIGGYLVRNAIEILYPRPWSSPDNFEIEFAAEFTFSAIVLLIWALIAVPVLQRASLRWVKRLVAAHAACILLAGLIKDGGIGGIFHSLLTFPDLIVLLYPGRRAQPETLRFARNATLVLSGGQVAAMLLWSWATVPIMMWNAASLAGDKPYCIATGQGFDYGRHGRDYRPVTALSDMQGLSMQAPQQHGGTGWWFNTFHAVLVVQGDAGTSWWNWSHRMAGFMPINHPAVFGSLVNPGTCHPEPGFLGKLRPF